MIIRKKEGLETNIRADGVAMTDFFGEACPAGEKISMGYAVFPPGTVVPPAAHEQDEYAYIISGKIKCESNGVIQEAVAGEATYIPAGEVHKSINDSGEDTTLVWMLVGTP